jgi:hypothetical protein
LALSYFSEVLVAERKGAERPALAESAGREAFMPGRSSGWLGSPWMVPLHPWVKFIHADFGVSQSTQTPQMANGLIHLADIVCELLWIGIRL